MYNFKLITTLCTLVLLFLVACDGGSNKGTIASVEPNPPTVLNVTPELDATEVALDASITITFEQAIDCDSFRQAFLLMDENEYSVDTTITCNNSVVSVAPIENLQKHTVYFISVSTLLKSLNGVALEIPFDANFITVAPTWSSAVEIGNHGTGEEVDNGQATIYYSVRVFEPKIAENLNGDALATWTMDYDNPTVTNNESGHYAAYFDSESTDWSSYNNLNLKTTITHPALPGVFASGSAIAAIGGDEDKDTGINYFLNLSGNWLGSQTIQEANTEIKHKLRNLAAKSFRAKALWEQEILYSSSTSSNTQRDYELWLSEYAEGTTSWPSTKIEATYISGTSRGISGRFIGEFPKLAIDNNGNTAIVYQTNTVKEGFEQAGTETEICSLYKINTIIGRCFPIEFPQLYANPQIMIGNSGKAVAVWEAYQYDENGSFDRALEFSEYDSLLQNWSLAKPINGINAYPINYEIAMNGAGKGVIAWMDPSDVTIKVKFYDSENGWGSTQQISNVDFAASQPRVAINDDSEIVVAFTLNASVADPNNILQVVSYKEGQGWFNSSTLTASLADTNYATYDIEIDEAGNAIVVWIEKLESTDSIVMAARLE